MKKRESGVLSVEASIVLTFFTLFVLFLFSFIKVYQAENMVSHATLQAADAVAIECALRSNANTENMEDVLFSVKKLTGSDTIDASSFEPIDESNLASILKTKFTSAVAQSDSQANEILEKYGVKNGLYGVNFAESYVDMGEDDIIVKATYTVKLKVSFFGANEIPLTKTAKVKSFGRILYKITASSQNPSWGTTSGGGKYQTGDKTTIVATPNYGYKFVKWSDGSTDSEREVTVNGSHNYVAIFEKDGYGVTVNSNIPKAIKSSTGSGNYEYNDVADISCTLNAGYKFINWNVKKHNDSVGGATSTITTPTVTQRVDQTYTFTAIVEPIEYKVSASAVDQDGKRINANVTVNNKKGSAMVKYDTDFTLNAPAVSGYRFLGWKEVGSNSYISRNNKYSLKMNKASERSFVAVYSGRYKVTLKYLRATSNYGTQWVTETQTIEAKDKKYFRLPEEYSIRWVKTSDNSYQQYFFDGWENVNTGELIYNLSGVVLMEEDTTFKAIYKPHTHIASVNGGGTCSVNHYVNKVIRHADGKKYTTECVRCCICKECGDFNSPLVRDANGTIRSEYNWCVNHYVKKGTKSCMKFNSDGTATGFSGGVGKKLYVHSDVNHNYTANEARIYYDTNEHCIIGVSHYY